MMGTSREDILGWLDRGFKQMARWMIVATDTFDYGDYPVFVGDSIPAFWKEYDRLKVASMTKIMEVYDLSQSTDEQLAEHRAMRLPPRMEVNVIVSLPPEIKPRNPTTTASKDLLHRELKKLPPDRLRKVKRVAKLLTAAHRAKPKRKKQAKDLYKEFVKANPRVKNHYMLRAKADVITALDGRSKPGRARFFCYAAYKVPGEAICLMPSAGDRSLTKVRSFPPGRKRLPAPRNSSSATESG